MFAMGATITLKEGKCIKLQKTIEYMELRKMVFSTLKNSSNGTFKKADFVSSPTELEKNYKYQEEKLFYTFSHEDREDILQTVAVLLVEQEEKILQKVEELDIPIKAFIYGIIKRTALQFNSRRGREDARISHLSRKTNTLTGLDDRLADVETVQAWTQPLDGHPHLQEVVRLLARGYDTQQVCDSLGISRKTLYNYRTQVKTLI